MADRAALEMLFTFTGNGGSNPSPSASFPARESQIGGPGPVSVRAPETPFFSVEIFDGFVYNFARRFGMSLPGPGSGAVERPRISTMSSNLSSGFRFRFAAALAFAAFFAASAPAQSLQGAVLALPNKSTDLTKWEVKKTPAVSGGASASKSRVWGVFNVAFATKPEWIDEMEITYSVLLFKKDADVARGEKQFHFFRTTVSYGDVAQGREHLAGVVLLPAALLRWGIPMGFAAQFTVDGEEVCEAYHKEAGKLEKVPAWWTNDNVTSGPATETHEGYLVDRAKSPFALVEPDSYEISRTGNGN